jgi:AcrR family transcriptional regulator
VSKPTLFKYFPTKQDLVLHRFADHQHEAARVVEASSGPPIEALRDHFLAGLDRHDPVTGLNDDPSVLAYYELVFTTPALESRLTRFVAADEEALAVALGGHLRAAVTAACLISVNQVLSRRNWQAMTSGMAAAAYHPTAYAEATTAYKALSAGL